MDSFKDIKTRLKKTLIGITAGLMVAGGLLVYNQNSQNKEFQKLPKEYQEKVIELKNEIKSGKIKNISQGEVADNISYFNESQDLIKFVLNSLEGIEKVEKNWDKLDTLDFMHRLESLKFRNAQLNSMLGRVNILIDKMNPIIIDKQSISKDFEKAQKALDERVKVTKSRLEKERKN
jgi:hypothetical protein